MHFCKRFRNLPIDGRVELTIKLRVCMRCLRKHRENEVSSVGPCHVCKSSHGILLYEDNEETTSILTGQPPPKKSKANKKVRLPERVTETLHITEEKEKVEYSSPCNILLTKPPDTHTTNAEENTSEVEDVQTQSKNEVKSAPQVQPKLQSCKIAKLQCCKVAKLQSCNVAKLQSCKVAKL